MQKTQVLKTNIIKIIPSKKPDSSSNYLANIVVEVDKKKFEIEEYINPIYNVVVTKSINSAPSIAGNDKSSLFVEMSDKLHLTHDDCKTLWATIVRKINALINTSAELRKIFPPLIDLIFVGQDMGFAFLKMTPQYHFSKTEFNGREQHICTDSIKMLIDELDQYAANAGVTESYSYQQLAMKCMGHPDIAFAFNSIGNGWILTFWGKEAGQNLSRKVFSLRDLYDGIFLCKLTSPFS